MANIPLKTLVRARATIKKIEDGIFDENDIYSLIIMLRPYAEKRSVFLEVADLVAHPNERNKGISCAALTAIADFYQYFSDYLYQKRTLDLRKPVPIYIHRLFLSQADRSDEKVLMNRFHMSRATIKNKINGNFKTNKSNKTCELLQNKARQEFISALEYLCSFIAIKPAFAISDFHTELLDLLEKNRVSEDARNRLTPQLDKISLAILCLMSGTTYTLPDGGKATCFLQTEHQSRTITGRQQVPAGQVPYEPSSFGALQINGRVEIKSGEDSVGVTFPVVSTELDPHQHCHPSLFTVVSEANEFAFYQTERLNLEPDMALDHQFRLLPASQLAL